MQQAAAAWTSVQLVSESPAGGPRLALPGCSSTLDCADCLDLRLSHPGFHWHLLHLYAPTVIKAGDSRTQFCLQTAIWRSLMRPVKEVKRPALRAVLHALAMDSPAPDRTLDAEAGFHFRIIPHSC